MSWKRCLAWSLFAGALVAVGLGVYELQPHEPRWTVDRRGQLLRFSPDGRKVFEIEHNIVDDEPSLPSMLYAVDVASGEKLGTPVGNDEFRADAFSSRCRYFAAVSRQSKNSDVLSILNVDARRECRVAVPKSACYVGLKFSPCEQYVLVSPEHPTEKLRVFETGTGEQILELPSSVLNWFVGSRLLILSAGKPSRLELWSLAKRKLDVEFGCDGSVPVISPSGRSLAYCPNPDEPLNWQVWDMDTTNLRCRLRTELDEIRHSLISLDERTLVHLGAKKSGAYVEAWDLETGTILGSLALPMSHRRMMLSPDGRLLATWTPEVGESVAGIEIVELPAMKPVWTEHAKRRYVGPILFTNDSRQVIAATIDQDEIRVLDGATARVDASIPLPKIGRGGPSFAKTAVGRHLLIRQPDDASARPPASLLQQFLARLRPRCNDVAIVYDLEASRERFRLQGWDSYHVLLADDANSLVTAHRENNERVLRCWDVGLKPLRYAIATPLALGALLLALAHGYRRWRKRGATAAAPPAPPIPHSSTVPEGPA